MVSTPQVGDRICLRNNPSWRIGNTVSYFKLLLILTAFTAVLGLGKSATLAALGNISEIQQSSQIHGLQIVAKTDRNLSNSKATLKTSAISVDPDEVTGIPKAEARRRFILNNTIFVKICYG
ncbi:MAG: hypothetical protein ABI180_15695 [Microcoleus sp.]